MSRQASPVTPEAVLLAADQAGCPVTPAQSEKLSEYLTLLVKWNQRTNLVGPRTWQAIFDTLVVDSLHLAVFMEKITLPAEPVCLDLGAGAGLPGLPLRTLWGAGQYLLVEVREKRAVFMRTALARMGLAGTTVFQGRAEDALTRTGGRSADLIVSRAFMPWRELLTFVEGLLTPDGLVVVLANEPAPVELPDGWAVRSAHEYPAAGKTRWFWALSRD